MLKALEDITKPDDRYAILVVAEAGKPLRPLELADHYATVALIDIGEHVPAEVRSMFDRARHAFIYAWFDYELTALAEQQALATLEVALRTRLGSSGRDGLRSLAEKAVAQGIFEPMLGAVPLPFALASLRNNWAHGSANFGAPSMALSVLDLCAEFIRKLYP